MEPDGPEIGCQGTSESRTHGLGELDMHGVAIEFPIRPYEELVWILVIIFMVKDHLCVDNMFAFSSAHCIGRN
jgi:hypothetical protein